MPGGSRRVCIVVDDRERRSPIGELLASFPEVQLEVRRLATGDYEVERAWVFERKTAPDFAASVIDGRLFRQAARLGRCHGGRALILEGAETDIPPAGLSREAWQGALIALGLTFHLPVLRSADAAETVRLLLYAGRQAYRQRDRGYVSVRPRARTRERQRLQVLAAFPGVGPLRARLLLERFGSIQAVVSASADQLTQVRGIGPATAGRIRSLVAP